ncbi:MAG: DMT family transporter [Chlorobiota bacterium]|nr:DMT family transporter [Chlorobiota bacterium]QQS67144.1 MAG: DMT family transporter [Chlorobiota bacterium]
MIYLLIFFQQLIASFTHLIGQYAVQHNDPVLVLFVRSWTAVICLWLFVSIKQKKINLFEGIDYQSFKRLIILGLLNIPINQYLYLTGLRDTTPANSALLYAMTPAMVLIIVLTSKFEKKSFRKILGLTIAFIGASFIMFERGADFHSKTTKGNIIIFLAVVAWSLFTVLGKPIIMKFGALRATFLHTLFGAIIYLPIAFIVTDLSKISIIDSKSWGSILFLGIGASCFSYVLWYYALSKLELSKVAIFQNLQPILTTIIALYLGKVILTNELAIGGVLTLIGVLLVQFG